MNMSILDLCQLRIWIDITWPTNFEVPQMDKQEQLPNKTNKNIGVYLIF